MKKICKFFTAAVIILILCFVIDLFISSKALTATYYQITVTTFKQDIRIVHISDLHNSEFGKDNQRLIKKILEQQPDIILITGDLLNSDENNSDTAYNLIESLVRISDVYISIGNHEIQFSERTGIDIESLYTKAGAKVLNENYVDIELKGEQIRIGGVYGYCLPQNYVNEKGYKQEQCNLLKKFQNTDKYKILMSHLPYGWWNYGFGNDWDVDLVLCGHTHGGQIILPFIGGLYDGETGWFPGDVYGYKDDGANIIVSRGLGNTETIPRLNNTPEVVVIDLAKE